MKATLKGGGKLRQMLGRLTKKAQVRAGVLEGSTMVNVENGRVQNVAEYAAMNEYGTRTIPSRPFMRQTGRDKGDSWLRGLKNMLRNGRDPKSALALQGDEMAKDIIATIESDMQPPNSRRWAEFKNKEEKARSGKTRAGTLIYTGALEESINWQFGDD